VFVCCFYDSGTLFFESKNNKKNSKFMLLPNSKDIRKRVGSNGVKYGKKSFKIYGFFTHWFTGYILFALKGTINSKPNFLTM
jgi:hypothetical protein